MPAVMAMQRWPANSRNPSLDVLRGMAVIAVILCHYPIVRVFSVGHVGVDLFFVLSGFLISGLLFADLMEHGSIRLGRFFFRRGMKIYPPFYVFLLLTWLCFPFLRRYTWTEALFLQNYYVVDFRIASTWAHLWTLAVEEHFYLCLPLVLLVLAKFKKLHWVYPLGAVLVVLCFGLRMLHIEGTRLTDNFQTHLRIDELFAGVALGYLYWFQGELFLRWSKWWLLPLGLLGLLTLFTPAQTAFACSGRITVSLFAFVLIVWWAVPRKINADWLAQIGQHSYSIYLWQMVAALFWTAHAITWLHFAGYFLTALGVGTAMSVIVEGPALYLRDRWQHRTRLPRVELVQPCPQQTEFTG